MAPKNKGKKGKKQDDDEFWCGLCPFLSTRLPPLIPTKSRENAGTSVAGNNLDTPIDGGDASDDGAKPKGKGKGGFSAFAALGMEDDGANDEEGEDFGGLMVRLVRVSLPWIAHELD